MSKKTGKVFKKTFGNTIGGVLSWSLDPIGAIAAKKEKEDKKFDKEIAKLKPVDIPTTTESVDAATKEAARLEEEKMRKRRGYKSTILTSNTGITQPATTMKTQLG